ncbi:MAG TPA: hypothetical protein VKB76_01750 [Ktedonobacterales bacterium]|nr:hypothetical protein [Ktedonobacterales bacterium]
MHEALAGRELAQRRSRTAAMTTALRSPTITQDAAIDIASISHLTPAPYAHSPSLTSEHLSWRAQIAQHWLRWHLIGALATLVAGTTLIASTKLTFVGFLLMIFGFLAVTLSAMALIFARYDAPVGAAILALTTDIVAILFGLTLIGPRLETLILFPSSLLITALLVDVWFVVTGSVAGVIGYITAVVLAQTHVLHPLLAVGDADLRWIDIGLVLIGAALMIFAIRLATTQLRRSLANEAATAHRLNVSERRWQAKRTTIDADSIALQTEIARTLRGATPRSVTTCEEMAPLANMINVLTMRLPGLLADREERLRLEKAIRDLANTLETAWAGFEWEWPSPSGTTVDRIISKLRPSSSLAEAEGA